MPDKRIFVTGGAGGLGKAIALRFAKAGYKVCVGDLHDERGQETEKELRAFSPDSFYVSSNVTDDAALESVKDTLEARWGGVDVVVNNAGVAGTAGAVEDVNLNDWKWVFDVNLFGVVRGIKTFTPGFKKQGSGHFVNIASAAGLISAPMMSNYNAVKAGVVSLSETMHVELGMSNINTSVVCPAFFKTNLMESMNSEIPGMDMSGKVNRMMARSAITADDIANDIFDAVQNNIFMVVPHKAERRLWIMKRLFPGYFFKQFSKKVKAMAVGAEKPR